MRSVILVGLVGLVACGGGGSAKTYDHQAAKGVFDEVDYDGPPGLSDLGLDGSGALWAIPERDRVLVQLDVPHQPEPGLHPTPQRIPIVGLPGDVDTESVAFVGANRIALGVEGQDAATAGVAWATLKDGKYVVDRTLPLEDTVLGVTLKKNHGAEGLCALGGSDLLVAIEETGRLPDGRRWAPLVVIHDGEIARVYKLVLGSDVGKISTLACDPGGHVAAIERHFGVSRVVTFEVPALAPAAADRPDALIEEKLVRDLAPILRDSLNLEGLATLPDGRVVAVADNQSASVEGPDVLLVFANSVRLK